MELQLDSRVAVRLMDSNSIEPVPDSACLYRLEQVQRVSLDRQTRMKSQYGCMATFLTGESILVGNRIGMRLTHRIVSILNQRKPTDECLNEESALFILTLVAAAT